MDITVIGHLCKDRIMSADNGSSPAVQFGGIVYSVAAMSAVSGPKDRIHPVFSVGMNDLDEVRALLAALPNVDTDGVFPVNGPTNEVTLIYGAPGTPRIECSSHIADPIPFPRVKPFLDTNGVLVNMVSGFDITLETLDHIRMAVRDARVPLHFDVHSLTLGIGQEDKRFRRPLTDWRRWAFMLSSVQMSEDEAAGLTAERYDEPTLINQMMPLMVQSLLITRGQRGVTVVVQDIHKRLTRTEIPGVSVTALDTTGCGDVFGAAYFRAALGGKDAVSAAREANEAAAQHASLPAVGKLSSLVEALRPRVDS